MTESLKQQPEATLTELRFRTVDCAVCGGSANRTFVTTKDRLHGIQGRFTYVTCGECGLLYQNPQVVPDDIPRLYPLHYAPWGASAGGTQSHQTRDSNPVSGNTGAKATGGRGSRLRRAARDLLTITGLPSQVRERLDSGGRLLDVGCGSGKFLARIRSDHPAAIVQGLDFSPQAVQAVRETMQVPCALGTLRENAPTFGTFDVITMWWYLEHDPDPRDTLEICRTLLKQDGFLAIGVPNARSVSKAVFRGYWFHLDPPRHLWIFNSSNISRLLDESGFRVVSIRHDLSPWGLLGSSQYVIQGGIKDVDKSWVASRGLQALTRPFSVLAGLAHLGDTIAVYATPR